MGNQNERQPRGLAPVSPADGGTPDIPTPEDFLGRLALADRASVGKIVGIVTELVDVYDGTHPAFFAVYGIGGNVTKQGERPDVDLLIVTSAYWDGGYRSLVERRLYSEQWEGRLDEFEQLLAQRETERENEREMEEEFDYSTEEGKRQARNAHRLQTDWICGSIKDQMEGEYSVEVLDELPDNYDMGAGTKGLLRLTPVRNVSPEAQIEQPDVRKPIDIAYVRAVRFIPPEESGTDPYQNRTLQYFETTTDVDLAGKPLPKVPLYRTDNRGREMHWHW